MNERRAFFPPKLLFVLCVILSGCVVEERARRPQRLPQIDNRVPAVATINGEPRYAWEIWPLERDLYGEPLRHQGIIAADKLVATGARAEALRQYRALQSSTLTPEEREALIVRVASQELALRQAKPALSAVSSYFKSTQKNVEDADAHVSLILAYGYAMLDNVDQSFAWASRARRVGTKSIASSNSASFLLAKMAQSLDEGRLESLASSWRADPYISGALAQEKRRRTFGGTQVALGASYEPLYEQSGVSLIAPTAVAGGASAVGGGDVSAVVGGTVVGAVLPLTGKYGALGGSVRNGIELAISAADDLKLTPVYKDDGGLVPQSTQFARELSLNDKAAFILGPLLSEAAEAVALSSSESSAPTITFSKKENSGGGYGVFRLGATASSQVRSLLNAIEVKLGLKRVAIIAPEDENGKELARLFKDGATERSMSVVFEGSFRRADPDGLVNLATAMEAHQPEAVFFADSIGEATRFFTALKPSVRSKLIPLGPGSWDNEAQLNRAKTALEGAIFVTPFFASSRKEIIVRFVEAYQARFKLKPDFLAAQGFDAATVALAALRKQNTEGIPFVQALTSVERYEGLTGTIRVQQSGEFERNFDVVTLRDGAVIELQKQVAESFVVQGAGDIERSLEQR